jgi:hypothetical protein
MTQEDEDRLTNRINRNAGISWLCHPEPWQIEQKLLRDDELSLPLNIAGSSGLNLGSLRALRLELGKEEVVPDFETGAYGSTDEKNDPF